MITSHNTCYPLEFPFNYTNRLSLLEFLHLISRYNDIIRICFTDYAKTLNLIVRDNQWLDFIADVEVTIVKTKIMEVYVIVNKRLDFFWLSGNFWLLSFKISYLCLPLFYETRTTPSCHPSGCAYRQL